MVRKGFVIFVFKVYLFVIYLKKKNLKLNFYLRGKYYFKKKFDFLSWK